MSVLFYMSLILWGCGEKRCAKGNSYKNQSKIQILTGKDDPMRINQMYLANKQETSGTKVSVQLKYFHPDFIEKRNPTKIFRY